ncbi:rod shape-determining protein MreC [Flavobacteriales bacterium]|nr:rod shape-determining protein MreC [Flavobacteriales bacterium]
MKNLFLFFNKVKFFMFFIVLQLIVFKIIVSNSSYQQTSILNSSSSLSGWFFTQSKSIKDYFGLKSVNKTLALQNASLKQESFHNYTIVSENEILIDKEIYKKKYLFQPSVVIQNSIRRRKNLLTLDVGIDKRITKEMGVVSSKGIVGFVKDVSQHYSTVLSLMNTEFTVPVIPLNDSCEGKLFWDKNDKINQVSVRGIPTYFKIKEGDTIVTQGGSGFFPPHEMVGTVTEVLKQAGSNNYLLKVKTSVDFNALNNVFIVKNIYKEELDSLQQVIDKCD